MTSTTVPAGTEAYFAFLDTSWRERAVKSPQLTPKNIQVVTITIFNSIVQDMIWAEWVKINGGGDFYLIASPSINLNLQLM